MRMGAMNKFMQKNSRTTELSKVIMPLIEAKPMTRGRNTTTPCGWVKTRYSKRKKRAQKNNKSKTATNTKKAKSYIGKCGTTSIIRGTK